MRLRGRLATTTAGLVVSLAMAAGLSGCMTVHGEEAVVPAATQDEAEAALEHYVDVNNEAKRDYDAEQNDEIEAGPLGAIDEAGLTARAAEQPNGDPDFEPLELTDTQFHIPQQAGWPKFFVADTKPRGYQNRWLMVFTRNSIDEDWRVSYLATLPAERVPEFAQDDDGYLEDIPLGGRAGSDLAVAPDEVGAAYADYLQGGEGRFSEGRFTTEVLDEREEANSSPAYQVQFQDAPAEEEDYAPVAMRTGDGGALVFFTMHHDERQTLAPGQHFNLNAQVEALLEGTPTQSLTLHRLAVETATVAEGDGPVDILSEVAGLITAEGE
ncbi:hypothetical protein [Streptomyces hoynatensis]|uniref:DUF8094 domain-containing protein n=1 Tax=Streptomyces hoynatensis TaxID=1141874 RepID=A0A3A9ZC53_9ACTN|nr:hypothetical protein [Streptomyces hoynatensis]RKN45901.1 hypothetical protein D7294_05565 [Streptomyces hoynatensis]